MPKKYSKKAQQFVKRAMHAYKRGHLKSGSTKKPVKNRQQAIAIGLSRARKKGVRIPQIPL